MFIVTLGDIVGIGLIVAAVIYFAYCLIYNTASEHTDRKKKPVQKEKDGGES